MSKLNRLVRWLAELPDTVPLDAELAVRAAEEAFAMNHGAGVVLAELYARLGRLDSAAECLAAGIQRSDDDPDALNSIAWFLVTAREPRLRDPARAVVLARKAVELNPKQGGCWGTLGVALYRAGDWDAAIAALNRANELEHDTGLAFNGFFLAMAYHKKGDAARARDWYNRSVAWSAQHKSDGRIRFAQKYHAEAAAVLDVKDQPVSGTRPLEVPTRPE